MAPGGFVQISAPNAVATPGWTLDTGSIDHINNYWNANRPSHSIDLNGLEHAA